METQYLNQKQAAAYCGFSVDHFRKDVLPSYELPKYGPKRNKYRIIDLDAFMAEPEVFLEKNESERFRGIRSRRRAVV